MTRLRMVLVASVALNLFLAGALVAGFIAMRNTGRMINAGALRIAGAELPVSERRPFRQALREARNAMHASIVDSRQAKAQAAQLLRQPIVDQAAVMAALDRARADDTAVRAAIERRAVTFAATLPPADRAKLADVVNRRAQQIPDIPASHRDGNPAPPR